MSAAESCTGGLISKKITDCCGSSKVFWGSLITYSNDSKIKLLSISKENLKKYGAVSENTVIAMASGILSLSGADFSVSVSGVAGPGGGTVVNPVGSVWICVASASGISKSQKIIFSGNRDEVREKAAESALLMVYNFILDNASIDS